MEWSGGRERAPNRMTRKIMKNGKEARLGPVGRLWTGLCDQRRRGTILYRNRGQQLDGL